MNTLIQIAYTLIERMDFFMRKERNCGMPYPMYQGGMMPAMPSMMPTPQPMGPYMTSTNTIEQQLNSMQEQINNLDNRVTRLENGKTNTTTNENKYNDSNYYML